MTEQPKIVKSFLSQHCIGYTANAESVTEYHVEYTDFSRGTLYGVGGQGSMRSPLRCWEDVPPIAVRTEQTKSEQVMGTRYLDVHSPDASLKAINEDLDKMLICREFCKKRDVIASCVQNCSETKDSFRVECGACRLAIEIRWKV